MFTSFTSLYARGKLFTFVYLCVWHSENDREITLKNGVG